MNSSSNIRRLFLATSFFFVVQVLSVHADDLGVRFQRPGTSRAESSQANKRFRRPGVYDAKPQAVVSKVVRGKRPVRRKQTSARGAKPVRSSKTVAQTKTITQKRAVRRDTTVAAVKRQSM